MSTVELTGICIGTFGQKWAKVWEQSGMLLQGINFPGVRVVLKYINNDENDKNVFFNYCSYFDDAKVGCVVGRISQL